MIDFLVFINLAYLFFEDYTSAKKNEDHIGYISLWACVSLVVLATFKALETNPIQIIYGLGFVLLWVFNAVAVGLLEKKNPLTLLGAGDYFLFYTVGVYMNNPFDFAVFTVFLAIGVLLYKINHKTHFFPLVPSIFSSFIIMFSYPYIFTALGYGYLIEIANNFSF